MANTNFVKRVMFPLETLTWSLVGLVLFHEQQVSVASGPRVIAGFRFRMPIFLLRHGLVGMPMQSASREVLESMS
ncbi:MAG: hypothetical protein ACYCZI_00550 [Metallibacterium scheffleri]